jgi:uncharacterized membrane protein YagU involved in acid resistance
MRERSLDGEANVWKGLAAGAAAGLVASWAMNEFQTLWTRSGGDGTSQSDQHSRSDRSKIALERNAAHNPLADDEDATMKLTGRIADRVFHRALSKEQKRRLSPIVHYAFGGCVGALYGASAEFVPQVSAAAGLPFGAVVFAGADEIGIPAMGLSKSPAQYPLATHLYGLASHLVYGATTALVYRILRRR